MHLGRPYGPVVLSQELSPKIAVCISCVQKWRPKSCAQGARAHFSPGCRIMFENTGKSKPCERHTCQEQTAPSRTSLHVASLLTSLCNPLSFLLFSKIEIEVEKNGAQQHQTNYLSWTLVVYHTPEEGEIHVESASVALLRVEVARRHPGTDGRAPVKLCVVPPGRIPNELVNVRRAHDAAVPRRVHQRVVFGHSHGFGENGLGGREAPGFPVESTPRARRGGCTNPGLCLVFARRKHLTSWRPQLRLQIFDTPPSLYGTEPLRALRRADGRLLARRRRAFRCEKTASILPRRGLP